MSEKFSLMKVATEKRQTFSINILESIAKLDVPLDDFPKQFSDRWFKMKFDTPGSTFLNRLKLKTPTEEVIGELLGNQLDHRIFNCTK